MSFARLGSVFNSNTATRFDSVEEAFLFGFLMCCVSLVCAIGMYILDKVEETRCADIFKITEPEPKCKDIYSYKKPFWLVSLSCMIISMSIFPYLQVVSDLMQVKYGLSSELAGALFGIPYTLTAIVSPFLGILIDKIGKRASLCIFSSIVLMIAFISSALLPDKP
jgi:hypothetical protein